MASMSWKSRWSSRVVVGVRIDPPRLGSLVAEHEPVGPAGDPYERAGCGGRLDEPGALGERLRSCCGLVGAPTSRNTGVLGLVWLVGHGEGAVTDRVARRRRRDLQDGATRIDLRDDTGGDLDIAGGGDEPELVADGDAEDRRRLDPGLVVDVVSASALRGAGTSRWRTAVDPTALRCRVVVRRRASELVAARVRRRFPTAPASSRSRRARWRRRR